MSGQQTCTCLTNKNSGIDIECGRHDAEDDNFAQGINDCFCRDGRASGNMNIGNL